MVLLSISSAQKSRRIHLFTSFSARVDRSGLFRGYSCCFCFFNYISFSWLFLFILARFIVIGKPVCLYTMVGQTFFSSNYRLNGAIAFKLTSWKSCKKNRHVNSIYYESWLQISARFIEINASSLKNPLVANQRQHSNWNEPDFFSCSLSFPSTAASFNRSNQLARGFVYTVRAHNVREYSCLLGGTFIIMQLACLLRWLALIWLCNIRNWSKLVYRIGELSTNRHTKRASTAHEKKPLSRRWTANDIINVKNEKRQLHVCQLLLSVNETFQFQTIMRLQ